ncbi:hypothetical protein RJ641_029448 [Dillenia turbinata]|uniref:J domain-containing protein n=1 Tax=Dillenia turbinata TaxID=194707 RepID=A0AAN8ZJH0_9MAGN
MDEIPVILEQNYGFKSQFRSAPMAALKARTTAFPNFGATTTSSNPMNGFNQKLQNSDGLDVFDHVFAKPTDKNSKPSNGDNGFFDYDSTIKKSSLNSDDLLSSMPSPAQKNAQFDDVFRNLGMPRSMGSSKTSKNAGGVDDLLSGFASQPLHRVNPETMQTKSTSSLVDDPFVIFESSSTPASASSGDFLDPLDQMNVFVSSQAKKVDDQSHKRAEFNGADPLDVFANFVPASQSSSQNFREKEKKPIRTRSTSNPRATSAGGESTDKSSVRTSGTTSRKKVPAASLKQSSWDIEEKDPRSKGNLEAVDDIRVVFSNFTHFTRPTSAAAPPSRTPPLAKSSTVSSIDELEDFARGRVPNNARRHSNHSNMEGDEYKSALASAAAAMKEAMNKAETKFRLAKEARERKSAKAAANEETVKNSTKENKLGADRTYTKAAVGGQNKSSAAAAAQENGDLDSIFGVGARQSGAPTTRATTPDPLFGTRSRNGGRPEMPQRTSSGNVSSVKKDSSAINLFDDLSSIFGGAPSSEEFQEIEGESQERRRARLERHQRTLERAAKALADKNLRDHQTQQEQKEKERIADTLDVEIKRWAAGKEGNLRAMLSTLQNVLWPECGWQPVSLTDLITAAAVKKVYRKATLCVHPDKVQQKGATLQQRYTAEKVFDLLKVHYLQIIFREIYSNLNHGPNSTQKNSVEEIQ